MFVLAGPLAIFLLASAVIVVCAACLRVAVSPDKPLAFHTLGVWALILLFANAANELALPSGLVALTTAAALIALVVAIGAPWRPAAVAHALRAQRRDIGVVAATMGLQIVLYLVPLAVVFPAGTLITGNFICNDSVTHAVLTCGYVVVHGAYAAWPHVGEYPDAFHAVLFAMRGVLPADPPAFLLPASIWSASFFGLAILMLLDVERHRDGVSAVLIAASPAAAFLLGVSVYLFFIGQTAVLPLVAAAVVVVAAWEPDAISGWRPLLLVLALMAAALAAYGLMSLSLIAFAAAIRGALAMRRSSQAIAAARAWIAALRLRQVWAAPAVIGLAVLPVCLQIYRGYAFFSTRTATFGNLAGFLSPLHVTGFWPHGLDYRLWLSGDDSAAAIVLAALLAAQITVVVRTGVSRVTAMLLTTLGVPVVASAILLRSPYIDFKFLYFLTSVWIAVVALGVYRAATQAARGRALAGPIVLACVVTAMSAWSLPGFRRLPALSDRWFQTLSNLRADHLSRGAVLILSREDWFHYYRDVDDVAPLTTYFHQTYHGQAMNEILVDVRFEADAIALLRQFWPDARERLGDCQGSTLDGRFRLYAFSCVAGARP